MLLYVAPTLLPNFEFVSGGFLYEIPFFVRH